MLRLGKLEIEDDVHARAAEMLGEVQVTLDLVGLPRSLNVRSAKRSHAYHSAGEQRRGSSSDPDPPRPGFHRDNDEQPIHRLIWRMEIALSTRHRLTSPDRSVDPRRTE